MLRQNALTYKGNRKRERAQRATGTATSKGRKFPRIPHRLLRSFRISLSNWLEPVNTLGREKARPRQFTSETGNTSLNLKTLRNESPAFNANASTRAVLRCTVDIFTSSRKMGKQRLNPPRTIDYPNTVFKNRFSVLPGFQLIGFPFRNWGGAGPFLIT